MTVCHIHNLVNCTHLSMLYVQILYKIIYAENIFEMYEEYEENIFEMYDCCNTSYHSYAEINLPIEAIASQKSSSSILKTTSLSKKKIQQSNQRI